MGFNELVVMKKDEKVKNEGNNDQSFLKSPYVFENTQSVESSESFYKSALVRKIRKKISRSHWYITYFDRCLACGKIFVSCTKRKYCSKKCQPC